MPKTKTIKARSASRKGGGLMDSELRICGISKTNFGVRYWLKYDKPFEFRIIVNDMTDVMNHEDVKFGRSYGTDVQGTAHDWGYRVSL